MSYYKKNEIKCDFKCDFVRNQMRSKHNKSQLLPTFSQEDFCIENLVFSELLHACSQLTILQGPALPYPLSSLSPPILPTLHVRMAGTSTHR